MAFDLKRIQRLYNSKKKLVAEKKRKDTNYMLAMGDMKAKDAFDNENLDMKHSIIAAHEAVDFYRKAFDMFRAKSDFDMMEVVKKKISDLDVFLKRFTADEIESALVFSDADILRNSSKSKFYEARYLRNLDRYRSIMLSLEAIEGFRNVLELYGNDIVNDSEDNARNMENVKSYITDVEIFLKRFGDDEVKKAKQEIEAVKAAMEAEDAS